MLAVSGRSGDVRASAAEAVKQDFLEADPYWDTSGMPNNTYKPKEPFTGKIVSYKPGTESSPSQGSRASSWQYEAILERFHFWPWPFFEIH